MEYGKYISTSKIAPTIYLDDVKTKYTVGNPATHNELQKWVDHMWSSGITHDCALTENGDGTVSIGSGTAVLRNGTNAHDTIYTVAVSAQGPISLTDNAVNYIYLDWNGGIPTFSVGLTVNSFNCIDKCVAFVVSREGTELHWIDAREQNVDHNRKHRRLLLECEGFQHVIGGSTLGSTTLNLTVTAGAFYYGLNKVTHSAFDTSASDTFSYYYRNGSGGWTKVTSQTVIDNLHYDDGTGTLAITGNNKYACHWVYVLNNSPTSLAVVYGTADYNSVGDAKEEGVPSGPPAVQGVGALIGRIIVQKSAASAASVESSFTTAFASSAATSHQNLGGLQGGTTGEYYHLTSAQHANLTATEPTFQQINVTATPTANNHAITKSYLENYVDGRIPLDPVLSKSVTTPPGSPTTGDRYIIGVGATGEWYLRDNLVAEFLGGIWVYTTPLVGNFCYVIDEDMQYNYTSGNTWAPTGGTGDHANLINLQGGAAGQYYHLTQAHHTDLTDAGDCQIHYHASDRNLGNATGILAVARGGTGAVTEQAAINNLTQVSSASNEYILTKDTATGNATWKPKQTNPLTGYTVTNFDVDKALDASSTTTAEIADVLATLIDDLQNGYAGDSRQTFETVSKNLKTYPYTITYNGDLVDYITYDLGGALTITKTLNYTGSKLTSVVLSGDTPVSIYLTKTLSYTGDKLTGVSYS